MRLYKDGGVDSCFDISAVIYRLLLLFLEKTAGFSGKEERGALVQLLDPFLEDHITEKITLESMADQCHLAPAYFCRRFHKETGLSPMQYLMKKRIETAKFYLLYTNEKVSVIAEKLGFYDSKHFSFCFGKVVGMPPTKYRSKNM
jgi:AraC-like DNA-binding protein